MAGPVYVAIAISAVVHFQCVDSQQPSVTIDGKNIFGLTKPVQVDGTSVNVETYLGIPYAAPPIGVNRFKAPQAYSFTEDFNATVLPKACLQRIDGDVVKTADDMSEDCLYLNIWKPVCNNGSLATIIWIHGGSLRSGSSAYPLYNGENLAAKGCVIVASLNYRLGPLGFLYTGPTDPTTNNSDANAGLLDVKEAVTFIGTHITKFGGLAPKITLMGGGAGAFIASIFLLAPSTRPLFKTVILQSGNPLMQLLQQSKSSALRTTNALAEALLCQNSSMETKLECLRQANGTSLVNAYMRLFAGMRHRLVVVLDNNFLEKTPSEYLSTGDIKICNMLVGINSDEGTETLMKIMPAIFNKSQTEPPVVPDVVLDQTLPHFLGILYKPPFVPLISSVLKLIYRHFILKDNTKLLSNVIRDLSYNCPQSTLIKAYLNANKKAFVYSFEHTPDNSTFPAWVGATHGTEIQYVFGTSSSVSTLSAREIELSGKIQTMWANFATLNDPTPEGLTPKWRQYHASSEKELIFTADAEVTFKKRSSKYCRFWHSIPQEMKF